MGTTDEAALTQLLREVRRLHRLGDDRELGDRLASLQPYDLAELLREFGADERLRLLALLPIETSAAAVEYLEPEMQYDVLHLLDPAVGVPLLRRLSSDVIVDLLLAVHPHQAERLLNWLPAEYRRQIDELMTFPENTVGSLATVDYIAVRENWTVEQTLRHVRKIGREAEVVSYIYVVDARRRLTGIASLREIILAQPDQRLADVMDRSVISVRANEDQEEAARVLFRYDFVALPVVDDRDRLIGIVTVDDLVDVMQEEATEDFQRLGGSAPLTESYFTTSVGALFRKRVGWLLVLFLGGAYTTSVLRHFEGALSQVVALSFFIPLLIGTGGNTGSQTVAILVRALAVGEVGFRDLLPVVGRELATGFLLGVVMGIAGYVRAALLGVGLELGPVIALSALLIVVWASLVAAVLPIVLYRLRIDPAVVSGPLITTVVDGTGLFLYFTMARLVLSL